MFFIAERTAKIRKIAVYCFLISLPVPELQRFKDEKFQIKMCSKKLLKYIKINKFVTSCAEHVDGIKE